MLSSIGGCRSNLNAAYALQEDFCQQSRAAAAISNLSFFVDMSHSQCFERGSQKFSHKNILSKRCHMESAVRETLGSILSLPSITRPVEVKTFH